MTMVRAMTSEPADGDLRGLAATAAMTAALEDARLMGFRA
jgi:hypothetical protein